MSAGSSRGAAWEATRLRVLNRDGWICLLSCGKPLEGADATVDHITPKAAGGTDDESNLIAACRTCNGRKRDQVLTRMPWFNPRWLERLP